MCYVGTVRANGCELKSEKELKKEEKCYSFFLMELNSNTAATRWLENRLDHLLSSYKGVEPTKDIRRWNKKPREYVNIRFPDFFR